MQPRFRHIAALALAALVAAAAVSTWEGYWRQQGYEPALRDDMDLWATHRHRVTAVEQARNFTVIGASRIQLAFSTQSFERAAPGWTATSLAINGHYPFAVLQELAADQRFAGVLLVATDARGLAHWYRDMTLPWVRHYRRDFGPQRRLERRLLSTLQRRLVSAASEFNLVRRLEGWIDARPPPRHYTRLLRDRTIEADYSMADVAGLRRGFAEALADDYRSRPPPEPARWRADLQPVAAAVEDIEARGGKVIFLRMPTAAEHWQLDQANYPRADYWEQLGDVTGATTIHFADHPALAGLELPDTSHIDRSDRDRFTRTLIRILCTETELRLCSARSAGTEEN